MPEPQPAAPVAPALADQPPPGWRRDSLHFPQGTAPYLSALWEPAARSGLLEAAVAYGMPVAGLLQHWPVPALRVQPESAGPMLVALGRQLLDPKLRSRAAAAHTAGARAGQELAWWQHQRRPALVSRQLELGRVSPDTLDARALAMHLSACHEQLRTCVHLHYRLLPVSALPVGEYLRAAMQWTGQSLAAAAATLPCDFPRVDADSAAQLLGAIPRGYGRDPALARTWRLTAPTALLPLLEGLLRSPLDGSDLNTGQDAAEFRHRAQVLEYGLRHAARGAPTAETLDRAAMALAEFAPQRHYRALLDLHRRARRHADLLPDTLALGPDWATGLLTTALQAAGKLLVERGLENPAQVLSLDPDELLAALLGGPLPAPRVQRALWPEPRPDAGANRWPAAMATTFHALETFLDAVLGTASSASLVPAGSFHPASPLRIEAAPGNGGIARGALRRIRHPAELLHGAPDDVLVLDALPASWPWLPPDCAAVLGRWGGPLSPLAQAARRAGIPAVTGLALDRLPADGSLVEVNGDAGTVRAMIPPPVLVTPAGS